MIETNIAKEAHQLHMLIKKQRSGKTMTDAELEKLSTLVEALNAVGTGTFLTRVRGFGIVDQVGLVK